MRVWHFVWTAAGPATLLGVAAWGCGADAPAPDDGAGRACAVTSSLAGAETASPSATFDTDVAPILVASCAFSSCHGTRSSGNHGLFLDAKTKDDRAKVRSGLLGPSRALPSMPYVTPGAPDESFLLRKLDGTLCTLDARCVNGWCGDSMPDQNPVLPVTTRDAVRRWIAQGAK